MDRKTTMGAIALLTLPFAAVACDADDGGIATRGQWCSVVEEVDDAFATADAGDVPFEEQQEQYAAIGDDLERLEDALEQVDDDARDAVGDALREVRELTEAFVALEDAAAADAQAEEIFGSFEEPSPDAVAWIGDNCDVDITS